MRPPWLTAFVKHNTIDRWVVEVVLDQLREFHDWFFRARMMPPLQLVALGGGGDMQCARYESGLDDSPMYDGEVR